jgi:predicted enzyme related to lactoylglutathione lyase
LADASGSSRAGVVWHQLNTNDASRAAANYVDLFGWALTERVELGSVGPFQHFAWRANEASVGSIADLRPGVHPHWLFFFGVPSVDAALEQVRTRGGIVVDSRALPSGARIAVCDDAQGAAFGLFQKP